jgi:hypothetical protein
MVAGSEGAAEVVGTGMTVRVSVSVGELRVFVVDIMPTTGVGVVTDISEVLGLGEGFLERVGLKVVFKYGAPEVALMEVGKALTEEIDVGTTPAAAEVTSLPTSETGAEVATLETDAEEVAAEVPPVWIALIAPEYKAGPGTM